MSISAGNSLPESAVELFQPGRLCSLWDILEIFSTFFLKVGYAAGASAAVLDPKAVKLDPRAVGIKFTGDVSAPIHYLRSLRELIGPFGAVTAVVEIDRLVTTLENGNCDAETLRNKQESIFSRIEDQLAGTYLLYVEHWHLKYFNNASALFGEQCSTVFSRSIEDIEEAGKCLALGRGTACVFHLMRAMEAAVQTLCKKLGIENLGREWGKLLSDMNKAIEPMPMGKARDEWSRAHANLYHVKQAWRNEVMHPKETYTEAQAEEVFEATRVFMIHLASLNYREDHHHEH